MKTVTNLPVFRALILAILFSAGITGASYAQGKMKTSLGIKVQGLTGQTKAQQEKDDLECHHIAKAETKFDPIYVPGATESKASKVIPAASKPGKAVMIPTHNKQRQRQLKRKPKGEAVPTKKEAKAHAKAADNSAESQQELVEEYKEIYRKCMIEKGYAVE